MTPLRRLRSDTRPVLALLALVFGGLASFGTALGVLGGSPDAAAGSEVTWTHVLPGSRSTGSNPEPPPAVLSLDGVTLAARGDGVAALDATTGGLLWTRELPVAVHGFGRDAVLVPVGEGRFAVALERRSEGDPAVAILDIADGATVWEMLGGVSSLEAVAGTVVVSGSTDRGVPAVTAYDAADGQQRWTYDLPAGEAWSAHLAANTDAVFVGFDAVRFDPETGQEEGGERILAALDLRSGEPRWSVEPDLRLFALDGAEGDDPLVVLGRQGEQNVLVGLDRSTGEEQWRWSPDDGIPYELVVDDGRVATLLDVSDGVGTAEEPNFVLVVLDVSGREVLRDEPRFHMRFQFVGDRLVIAHAPASVATLHPRAEMPALLTVVDLTTGDETWQREYSTSTAWNPLRVAPSDGALVVSQSNGAVHRVDLHDGQTAWTTVSLDSREGQTELGPVATSDAVYLLAGDGAIRSIAATDGAQRWARLHSVVGASPPTVDGRRVYAATGLGIVRAYDRQTGEVVWATERRHDVLEESAPRPAVAAGTVVVADPDGTLLALDSTTGEQRWTGSSEGVLAVAGQGSQVVVAHHDGGLVSLHARTGDEAWRTEVDADLRWGPFPAGDTLLVVTTEGQLVALDAANGAPRWTSDTDQRALPRPALDATSVYVLTDRLTALDLVDGSVRWEAPPGEGASFTGHLAVAPGQVFVTATDLTARVLSTATGESADVIDIAVPIEAISATPGGLLVVETSEGELRAYR